MLNDAIQQATIERLKEITADYAAQHIPLHEAFRGLGLALIENTTLTGEQRTQTYLRYSGHFDQCTRAHNEARERGNRSGKGRREPEDVIDREDGVREPDVDGAAQSPDHNANQLVCDLTQHIEEIDNRTPLK